MENAQVLLSHLRQVQMREQRKLSGAETKVEVKMGTVASVQGSAQNVSPWFLHPPALPRTLTAIAVPGGATQGLKAF